MTPDATDKQLERIKLFPTAPVVFSSFPYTSKVTDNRYSQTKRYIVAIDGYQKGQELKSNESPLLQ
jgi:hypothetical protein